MSSRSVTILTFAAAVLFGVATALTVYMFRAHDPADGANIGGGIGVFASIGSAVSLALALAAGRVNHHGMRFLLTAISLALLVVSLLMLSLTRPFSSD